MENTSKKRGTGLVSPQKEKSSVKPSQKGIKTIPGHGDGLMEREELKVLTEDGRELLKED